MDQLTIALGLRIAAPSQYVGYDFNSFCVFNGVLLGAGEGGIFQLESGDKDNGVSIDGWVEFIATDLGMDDVKEPQRVTVNCKADGQLLFVESADGGPALAEVLPAGPLEKGYIPVQKRLRRTCRGKYLKFIIRNLLGSYFSIDGIWIDVARVRGVSTARGA